MELHELKNTWTVLDEQLKKNENLNFKLQEVLLKKSDNSLQKLFDKNIFSAIVATLLLLICSYASIYSFIENDFLSMKVFYTIGAGIAIYALIRCFYEIKYLNKIDFSNSIKDNLMYIYKFEILNKRGRLIGLCIGLPILFSTMIYCFYEHTMHHGALVGFVAGLGLGLWLYKKIVKRNIQSIKESLEELKELKD